MVAKVRSALAWAVLAALVVGLFVAFARIPSAAAETKPVTTEAWEELAQCESGGDWAIDSGNGFSGGLQFADGTWAGHGGTEFAPKASKATKEQQIWVANEVLKEQGWKAWPACTQRLGFEGKWAPVENMPKPSGGSGSDDGDGTQAPGEDAHDSADDSDGGGGDSGGGGGDDTANDSNGDGTNGDNDGGGNDDANGGTDDAATGDNGTNGGEDALGNDADAAQGDNGEAAEADAPEFDPYAGARMRPTPDQNATSENHGSPAQYAVNAVSEDGFMNAIHYLAFDRYKFAASPPEPPDLTMASIFPKIATFMASLIYSGVFVIGSFMGYAMTLIVSVDIVGRGVYIVDLVFARLAGMFFGVGGVNGENFMTGMLKLLFAAIVASIVWQLLVRQKTYTMRSLFGPFLMLLAGIGAIGVIGSQAARNHASIAIEDKGDLSPIGSETADIENGREHAARAGSAFSVSAAKSKDPKNWAVLSPGWMIAWGNQGAKMIGAVAVDISDSLFGAITYAIDPQSENYSECDLYMAGSHAVFMNTEAARGGRDMEPSMTSPGAFLLNFDNMFLATMHRMWVEGSFGDTAGAGGTWCRYAEAQAGIPAAEQAMISRVAGLYPEVVGTGGLGMVRDSSGSRNTGAIVFIHSSNPALNGRPFATSSGTLVKGNGNWNTEGKIGDPGEDTGENAGANLADGELAKENNAALKGTYVPRLAAERFFGPLYRNVAGSQQALFYFAGCDYTRQGEAATIRDEWKGAVSASTNEPLKDSDWSGSLTNGESYKGGFGEFVHSDQEEGLLPTATAWNYSPIRDDTNEKQKLLETEEDDGWTSKATKWIVNKMVDTMPMGDMALLAKNLVSDSESGVSQKFGGAQRSGAEVTDSGRVIPAGNAPMDLWKHVNGRFGVSQITYSLLGLVLAVLLIKTLVPMLLGALIAQAVVVVSLMFSVLALLLAFLSKVRQAIKSALLTVISALLVVSIIQIMITLVFNIGSLFVTLTGVEMMGAGMVRSVVVGLCYILAFKLVVAAFSRFTGFDLSTIRGAMAAGAAAGAPALQSLNARVRGPLDPGFWSRGRQAFRDTMNGGSGEGSDATVPVDRARRAVSSDAKKRRLAEADKAAREKGSRRIPKAAKAIAGAGAAVARAKMKEFEAKGSKKPLGAATIMGAKAAGKAAGKTMRFGAKTVKLGHKTTKAATAAAKAATGVLDADGRNGSNRARPFGAYDGRAAMPAHVRAYRGSTASSGGGQVNPGLWEMLSEHPFRAMKDGKLGETVLSALGFVPEVNSKSLSSSGFMPLTEDNIEQVIAVTPGLRSAPLSDAPESDTEISGFDAVNEARRRADQAHRPVRMKPGEVIPPEDFERVMEQASAVGGAAGADRPTFVPGDAPEQVTQAYRSVMQNASTMESLDAARRSGFVSNEAYRTLEEAMSNGVNLNHHNPIGAMDATSRAMSSIASAQALRHIRATGGVSEKEVELLQQMGDLGVDIRHADAYRDTIMDATDLPPWQRRGIAEHLDEVQSIVERSRDRWRYLNSGVGGAAKRLHAEGASIREWRDGISGAIRDRMDAQRSSSEVAAEQAADEARAAMREASEQVAAVKQRFADVGRRALGGYGGGVRSAFSKLRGAHPEGRQE